MKKNSQTITLTPQPFWQKYMHVILCVFAFLLYANTINHGYNMDDELVTRKHKLTSKGISAIPKIFSSPYYSDEMGYSYEYRPVVLTSFAIEHQFFGESAKISHFFNVLLYVLTVYLLFILLKKLFHSYSYWFSVVAVALFIFHPLHTEAIASIKNRDEILAMLGGIGAWWFAIQYVHSNKWWKLIPMTLFLIVGLLSKMSITPIVFLIPMSLMFFFQPKGRQVLITSFLLVTAAFIFSPLSNPIGYAPVYIAIALIPYIFWLILEKKYNSIFYWISENIRAVKRNTMHEISQDFAKDNPSLLSLKLHNNHLNLSELTSGVFIMQTTVFLLATVGSLFYSSLIGFTCSFLYFAFLFYNVNITKKNVLVLLFTASFIAFSYVFDKTQYTYFLGAFLFYLLFFDVRFRNVIHIITVLLFTLSSIWFREFDVFNILLLFLVLLLANKYKLFNIIKGILFVILILLFSSAVIGVIVQPAEFFTDLFVIINTFILGIVITVKSRKLATPLLLFLIFPFIILINVTSKFEGVTPVKPALQISTKSPQIKMPEGFISSIVFKTQRPISYAEMPVNHASPIDERIGSAFDVMGFYLGKMIIPYPLGYYYGYAYFEPITIFEVSPLIFLLIHIGLFLVCAFSFKKNKILSFGILFYLASISLFSGFLYPVVGVAGDRFAYMASLGFCVAFAYLVVRFGFGKNSSTGFATPSIIFMTVCGTILLSYGTITILRNSKWENALTLMSNDIDYLNESAQAHNLYALNLMRESFENKKILPNKQLEMRKEAVVHFDRALQIWPDFFNAAYDKGRAAYFVGDIQSSIEGYEQAVKIGPEDGFVEPYIQLAQLYLQTQRYPDFLRNAKLLLSKKPEAESYNMVARGFFLNGRNDSAKIYLRNAMLLFPQDNSLKKNMSEIFRVENNSDSTSYYLGQ